MLIERHELGDGVLSALLWLWLPALTTLSCAAPPLLPAPAPTVVPGPNVLDFDVALPNSSLDSTRLEHWTRQISQTFLDTANDERQARLQAALQAEDAITLTPAYLNAVIGLDMDDPSDTAGAAALTAFWMDQVSRIPRFYFSVDPTRGEQRATVLALWRAWWDQYANNPQALAAYRKRVEEHRAQEGTQNADRP